MLSLKLKYLPLILSVILVVGFVVVFFVNNFFSNAVQKVWIKTSDESAKHSIEHVLEGYETLLNSHLERIIKDGEVISLFKSGNREELYNGLKDYYQDLLKYNVEIMQFTQPDNKSFLRMHKPESFGDDLSFRKTITKVNTTKQKVTAVEPGRSGVAFRVLAPIFDNNEYLGLLELGVNLDDEFLKKFSNMNELVLLADDKGKLEKPQFVRLPGKGEIASEIDLSKFIKDENYYEIKNGHLYLSTHFRGVDGETVAILLSKVPLTEAVNLSTRAKVISAVLELTVLIILIIVTILFVGSIQKQVNILKSALKDVEKGDLTVKLASSSQNEIGEAVSSVSQAIEKLRASFVNVADGFVNINTSISGFSMISEKFEELAKQVEKIVERVNSSVQTVSAATEETTSGVEEISAAAQNVAESAQEISTLTNSTFEQIESSMNSIKELVSKID